MAVFSSAGLAADRNTFAEYLESDGNQYINTEFKPNQNTRIVVTMSLGYFSTAAKTLFGTRDASATNGFAVIALATGAYQVSYGKDNPSTVSAVAGNTRTYELDKNGFKINGETVYTPASQSFSCSYPAYLLGLNDGGSAHATGFTPGRLYSCQIYDNGTLVRDCYPYVDSAGVACLYDNVEKKCYYNAGTGEFIAG